MKPFDVPQQKKDVVTGKHVAIIAGLAIALLSPLGWMVYQQRTEAEAKVEAVRAARIQKDKEERVLSAAMVSFPLKPIEPARVHVGKAGKARKVGSQRFPFDQGAYANSDVFCIGPLQKDYEESWAVYTPDTGACVASSNTPNGWDVADTGEVVAPKTAKADTYRMTYNKELMSQNESESTTYEFEVVSNRQANAIQ